jgi:hypothetical protein
LLNQGKLIRIPIGWSLKKENFLLSKLCDLANFRYENACVIYVDDRCIPLPVVRVVDLLKPLNGKSYRLAAKDRYILSTVDNLLVVTLKDLSV